MFHDPKPGFITDGTGFNSCPIRQPCNDRCGICNYFSEGDIVKIVTRNYGGYPARIGKRKRSGTFRCEILDDNMNAITKFSKFPSGLRKILEPNDINYWTKPQ